MNQLKHAPQSISGHHQHAHEHTEEQNDLEVRGEKLSKWYYQDQNMIQKMVAEKEKYTEGLEEEHPLLIKEQIEDKNTPDYWVKRSASLIRLTGLHPFNSEPSLKLLMEEGLITPSSIHYVRNHGYVPRLNEKTYKLTIEDYNKKKFQFTINQLRKFPSIKITVTISCDGNRRKEVNMIKHTNGFNWGPGGVSTSTWKGVKLKHLLNHCGIFINSSDSDNDNDTNTNDKDEKDLSEENKEKEQKLDIINGIFCCFEGSEVLKYGKYGTSFPLEYIMDETNDVMLAYEMNEQVLPPDHGYPLRLIVPGMVGGRHVKWLERIYISNKESDSWYHWHDNKVYPPLVDSDTSAAVGKWYESPQYTLYELNVQSIITHPLNQETIDIKDLNTDFYTIKGFAYSGGGRPITRVELTFDQGITWNLAQLQALSKSIRHGWKSWTWVFWKLEIPKWKFLTTKEISVRAFDRGMNGQPEQLTWNLLGMMNNSWYKIKIEHENINNILFKHPVQPGIEIGGWMVPSRIDEAYDQRVPAVDTSQAYKPIPIEEVVKHNKKDDCWVILDGRVYDFTPYLKDHPGGVDSIACMAGQNASLIFHSVHQKTIDLTKEMYCIGNVVTSHNYFKKQGHKKILNFKIWNIVTLTDKIELSHNVKKFIFKFKEEDGDYVGLLVGQHLLLGIYNDKNDYDNLIVRPYTPTFPINLEEDNGNVELIIKLYPNGVMSEYLESLQIGNEMMIKGPTGHILYHGNGHFTISNKTFRCNRISMICGGSGITPIYQLTKAIIYDKNDSTQIRILYSNHSIDDTLLFKELQDLEKLSNNKCKIWFTISETPNDKNDKNGKKDTKDQSIKDDKNDKNDKNGRKNKKDQSVKDDKNDKKDKNGKNGKDVKNNKKRNKKNKNIKWKYSIGRINEKMIRDHIFDPDPFSIVFLCGPPPLIELTCFPNLERMGYTIGENVFEF